MDIVGDDMVVDNDVVVGVGFGGGRAVLAMDGCGLPRRLDNL